MRILISGASGLIGSALIDFLSLAKYEVYKLTRARAGLLPHEIPWDPHLGLITPALLEGFDGVVHLAGESIVGRWTIHKKEEILRSRVQGTKLLADALSRLKKPPKVWISASAIGFYGHDTTCLLQETSPQGKGFLAKVCGEWEKATQQALSVGIRTVLLRMGVVLSPHGGMLKKILFPFQCGLGGVLGDGTQYMSWIDMQDLVGLIYYLLKQPDLSGPINAVSPHPVTNREFTETLARLLHRPAFFRIPPPILSLLFGEAAKEVFLSNQQVEPSVLLERGFLFRYPEIEESLKHLLSI